MQVLQQLKGFIQVHSCIDQGGASGARQWYWSQCNKYIICTYILVQVLQQLKGFIQVHSCIDQGVPVLQDSGTGLSVTNISYLYIYTSASSSLEERYRVIYNPLQIMGGKVNMPGQSWKVWN